MDQLIPRAVLCLFLASASLAQNGKTPLYISQSGEDSIGSEVAFALKEAIRRSASYELSGPDSPIRIQLGSLDVDSQHRASLSVVSVTGTVDVLPCDQQPCPSKCLIFPSTNHLFVHSLHLIGSQRTEEEGKYLLAEIDSALAKFKEEARSSPLDPPPR